MRIVNCAVELAIVLISQPETISIFLNFVRFISRLVRGKKGEW